MRARNIGLVFFPLLAMLGVLIMPGTALADELFLVIAHPDVPVNAVALDELGRMFTRDVTEWPDGTRIVPVELAGATGTREAFYKATLNTLVEDIASFWIREAMTSGRRPPRSFSNPDLVVNYVAKTPGAIGFVAAGTHLRNLTVKTLRVR
ncbi:MAG: hypothetical protein OEY97_02600 [Nitrospirota bacterium]|nr:hypothetical protein [Nitrospirota bacterium]